MNEHDNQHGDADEPQIPARLAQELKALYAPPQLVPARVDDSLLGKARRYLAQMRGLRPVIRFPQWLAAAAAVILCALVGSLWLPSKRSGSLAREDLNLDGRVDVLDAFELARRLQQGAISDPAFDFNADGVVDQKDIDAVAARAVMLAKVEKGQG
jgi:hypothetical protein